MFSTADSLKRKTSSAVMQNPNRDKWSMTILIQMFYPILLLFQMVQITDDGTEA